MKSKLLSALLCVSMVAVMLTGCGSAAEESAPAAETEAAAEEGAPAEETEQEQVTASEASADGGYDL